MTLRASVVLLCHNALDYTAACVESLARHTPESHEVVLVDNGSSDGTADWFTRRGEGCLVRNRVNLGFAAGANQGIAASEGETVVLLNNDALATPGWLGPLLDALADPSVGIAAPMSNFVTGRQLIDPVPYTAAPSPELDAYAVARAAAQAGRGFDAGRLSGLCMAIPRRLIDAIGGLDPAFAVGNFEDDDYSLRARLAGFRLRVREDSFVHHFGHKTFALLPERYESLLYENGARFLAKWSLPADADPKTAEPARAFDPVRDRVPI